MDPVLATNFYNNLPWGRRNCVTDQRHWMRPIYIWHNPLRGIYIILVLIGPLQGATSTVYWCIASKLKAPRNFYWMSNMFLCAIREPDFHKFLKKPQNMFSWCFLSISRYFSIVRNLCWEPHFWAENRIFQPRTGFSRISQKPQNMLSWCFLSVSWYFSFIRLMSREPDFSAKNRIFKNFLKCLKACLVGVFWVFQSIFSIVRYLGREPDFWAENRIFTNILKILKTCLVGVFWVFQGTLA